MAVQTGADSTGMAPPGAVSDEGSGEVQPPGPPARTITRKPAMAFLGLVALVGIGGFAMAALESHPGSSAPPPSAHAVKGTSLAAVSAKAVLRPILRGGEPPSDIAGALIVPARSRPTGAGWGAGLSLYDCVTRFSVRARPAEVVSFFRAELRHEGWKILAVDATVGKSNGTVVYAQLGSSDGFYWEVGARVEPVTPSITPALSGGGQTAPTSAVSLRIVERNDAD